ncbi:unnamed protein product [Effrenium voratum]|uniref:Uncharacterized protein n=1 Tax=Effrenium voratum TaxID=2562239 RepID=A0AA36ISA9_9DINO|nr:unnamed protein product [Effrenium voratum]
MGVDPLQQRRAILLSRPRRGAKCRLRINTSQAQKNAEALEMVAKRSGWELVNKSGHILWVVRKEDVAESLLQLQPGQWLSHIPGMHEACSKASLANAFKATASFWPRTWVIQGPERPDLADMLSSGFVIVKPNRGLQGKGIHLACSSDELQRALSDDVVVQQYISRPLLLDARKWDLRLYALVLPHEDGLRCWLAREGIARVCADIYEELSHTNAKRDTMHLTNYSLNKRSEKFVCNEDPGSGHRGGKRALSAVLLRLQKEKLIASAASVWEELGNLVQHTAGAMRDELQKLALDPSTWDGREEVVQAVHTKFSQSFHILGIDVLLDSSGKPWLLEVNCNPSFSLEEIHPSAGLAKASDVPRALGQPCGCPAHPQVHTHQLSPVDMAVKLPVLEGAVTIVSQLTSTDPTAGTIYTALSR